MFNNYPYVPFGMQPSMSLFSRLRGLNFAEILNGTQRTLNVVNQAIPIFYQIRPLWNNTKTIFKIANAINEDDSKKEMIKTNDIKQNIDIKEKETTKKTNYNEPVFFL